MAEQLADNVRACDNHAKACTNAAVRRYARTENPGLDTQHVVQIVLCDACWAEDYHTCARCHGDASVLNNHGRGHRLPLMISSSLLTGRWAGGIRVSEIPHGPYKETLFHGGCGELCAMCARFVLGKLAADGEDPGILRLENSKQSICIKCRGGWATDAEFLQANAAFVETSDSGETSIKPASQVGCRHVKKAADPPPATPKKRAAAAKTPAKKRGK